MLNHCILYGMVKCVLFSPKQMGKYYMYYGEGPSESQVIKSMLYVNTIYAGLYHCKW